LNRRRIAGGPIGPGHTILVLIGKEVSGQDQLLLIIDVVNDAGFILGLAKPRVWLYFFIRQREKGQKLN